ncbi:MAG TPA: 50S ribosomal protein L25 [Candidatus Elarobacter sp.]|jgi:large subunit ribosomal protein L25
MPKHSVSVLTLEPRTGVGTTAAQALRRAGKVPGVVYGHGRATPISIDVKQLAELILSGNKAHIVDAMIDGTRDSVLLRKIEAHPLTRKPLSVDFQRVGHDEEVTASVHITTTGTPAGVRDQGGVMDVVAHALDVKGPAASIPDSLTIDVSGLQLHQHVTAGDVALPPGFTLLTAPDTLVITVEITRANVGAGTDDAEQQPTEAPAG